MAVGADVVPGEVRAVRIAAGYSNLGHALRGADDHLVGAVKAKVIAEVGRRKARRGHEQTVEVARRGADSLCDI